MLISESLSHDQAHPGRVTTLPTECRHIGILFQDDGSCDWIARQNIPAILVTHDRADVPDPSLLIEL